MSGSQLLRIVDYGPYINGESPGTPLSTAQMDQNLATIATMGNAVRVYTVEDNQSYIVQNAMNYGLQVIPSVFLDNPNSNGAPDPRPDFSTIMADDPNIMKELNDLITVLNSLSAAQLANIPFVVIGNEEITQVGGWSGPSIMAAIDYVRSRTPAGLKFTTAEPADVAQSQYLYDNNGTIIPTDLGNAVDVIYANSLPYWENLPIGQAVTQVVSEYQQLQKYYPGKEVVISETGWPSGGSQEGSAVPNVANEQAFYQQFIPTANQDGIQYGAFEAYDEAWKVNSIPGNTVEAYWGLLNDDGTPKTSITNLFSAVPPNDFNGDGQSDILLQNINGGAAIWLMNGTTLTTDALIANPGTTWHAEATGDFNGDDNSDIAWQAGDGSVAVWEMNGATIASSALIANPGTAWQVVGSGNFDGGADTGLLLQATDGSVAMWEMNGTTIASSALIADPGANWHVESTGDFNQDGKTDIVLQSTDGSVAVWLMNGTTLTSGAMIANPGPTWHVEGTGDFASDGNTDIVLQNDNGQVDVWMMNGTTLAGGIVVADPGSAWQVKGIGDYSDGGQADILLQNSDGSVAIWEMTGPTMTVGALITNPGSTWTLGDDHLTFIGGGPGDATLNATFQPDEFVMTSYAQGENVINGFNTAQDIIEFGASSFTNFAAIQAAATNSGSATSISLDNAGNTLLLPGVAPDALVASDFRFA